MRALWRRTTEPMSEEAEGLGGAEAEGAEGADAEALRGEGRRVRLR